MSNKEFFLRTTKLKDNFGGSVVGRTEDGEGTLVISKYGLFSAELTETGDLFADFSDNGITCIYDDHGVLDTVSLDVEDYLCCLSDIELDDMPMGGEDIMRALEWLVLNNKKVVFSVRAKTGIIDVVTFGLKDDDFKRETSEIENFQNGVNGTINLNGVALPFAIIKSGDEFTLGIGEANGKRRVVNTTMISNSVDFIDDVLSGGLRDLQRLAGKILLN